MTYSNNLRKKFERIKSDIQKGELPTIKYFQSGNFRGDLKNVPRVIIGVEIQTLTGLCRALFQNPDAKRLSMHPLQMLQLKQMLIQLEAFGAYAIRLGQTSVAEEYARDREIVKRIFDAKAKSGITIGEWENDKVFKAIQKELEVLKGGMK